MHLTIAFFGLAVFAATGIDQIEHTETRPIPYVDRLIPYFAEKWGIRTRAELRAALDVPARGRPRNDAWIAQWIGDAPRSLEIYTALREKDPTDGEAVLGASLEQLRLGREEQALRDLEASDLPHLRQIDPRSSFSKPQVYVRVCRLQTILGKLDAARKSCEAGIDAGARESGSRWLARVLLGLGAPEEALRRIDDALQTPNPSGMPVGESRARAWYIKGSSLEAVGRRGEAVDAFRAALRSDPFYTPAQWALDTPGASTTTRLQLELGFQNALDSEWTGRCGHIYLELEMPDRAKRCFTEAERVGGGLGEAERIYHLAETQPSAALDRAEAIPAGRRHRLLWWLIAAVHHQQGRDAAARVALEKTLDKDPRYAKAHKLYIEVCQALHDEPCARHHAAIMAGEPGR